MLNFKEFQASHPWVESKMLEWVGPYNGETLGGIGKPFKIVLRKLRGPSVATKMESRVATRRDYVPYYSVIDDWRGMVVSSRSFVPLHPDVPIISPWSRKIALSTHLVRYEAFERNQRALVQRIGDLHLSDLVPACWNHQWFGKW